MRKILPLVVIFCFVAACNRPMLQPPGTQTPPSRRLTETGAALAETIPAPDIKSTQTSTALQIAATSTKRPTNSPPPGSTSTPKSSATPYPTPAWCPVASVTPATIGKLRIAYASTGSLWLWDEGESARQLIKSGNIQQVSLSDDGQIIAFTRKLDDNHQELWAVNVDGSNERKLISADEFVTLDGSVDALGVLPTWMQWEPGSHHLVFFTYPIYDALWVYEPSIPWLLDIDSGVISAASYHGGYIKYAPDGKNVVIFNMTDLDLIHLDGSNLREDILSPYHGIGLGESFYDPQPSWADDSTSLMVALPNQDDLYSKNASVTVWRVPLAGDPEALGQWKAFAPSVSFSPDQATMAYWPWPEGTANQRELHLARLDGKTTGEAADVIYIRGELIDNLAWSLDSQHIIFSMVSPNSVDQIYLGDVCSRPKLILEGERLGTTSWVDPPVAWVDTSRYLLEIQQTESNSKLRLGNINKTQTELLGVITSYDWTLLP